MTRTPARRAVAPWSDLIVLGIDPSLTGTGIALVKGGVLQETGVYTSDPATPRPARLAAIRTEIMAVLLTHSPLVVAMETEIFGMPHQASEQGAIQGVLQLALWDNLTHRNAAHPGHYLPVSVSQVKKWIGAKLKNEILLQVYKQYGLTFSDHNAADATVIAMIADAYLARASGHEWSCWTKPQQEVLKKLEATGFPWEAPPVKKVRKPKKGAAA